MPINLNERGLSEGDDIAPYLDQYWEPGAHVTIDGGTYTIDPSDVSSVFPASYFSGTSILEGGGPGDECVIETGGNGRFDPYFYSSGHMEIKHLTFRGQNWQGSTRVVASSGNYVRLENYNIPDGNSTDTWRSAGVYVSDSHSGTADFVNCHIEGHNDNGLYASNANGEVNVFGGLYKNNNISNIRLGTDDCTVVGCAVVVEENQPQYDVANNHRGLWLRHSANSMRVEDVDVWFGSNVSATAQILLDESSSGTVDNCRLTNHSSNLAIHHHSDGTWTGSGLHFTGNGDDHNPLGWACNGSSCNEATTEKRWYDSDGPASADPVDPTDGDYWGLNPNTTDDSVRIGNVEIHEEHPFEDRV